MVERNSNQQPNAPLDGRPNGRPLNPNVLSQEAIDIQMLNIAVNENLAFHQGLIARQAAAQEDYELAQQRLNERRREVQEHERELNEQVRDVKRRIENAGLSRNAFCYHCLPNDNVGGPESMLEMFADLTYQRFHCGHRLCRDLFHNMIPPITIGWSCCEPDLSVTESDSYYEAEQLDPVREENVAMEAINVDEEERKDNH